MVAGFSLWWRASACISPSCCCFQLAALCLLPIGHPTQNANPAMPDLAPKPCRAGYRRPTLGTAALCSSGGGAASEAAALRVCRAGHGLLAVGVRVSRTAAGLPDCMHAVDGGASHPPCGATAPLFFAHPLLLAAANCF